MCGLLELSRDVLRRQLKVFVSLRQDFDAVAPLLTGEGAVTPVVWIWLCGQKGFKGCAVCRGIDAVGSLLQPLRHLYVSTRQRGSVGHCDSASKRAPYLGIKTPDGMLFHSVFGVYQQIVQGHGLCAERRIEFPVRIFLWRAAHMGTG